MKKQVNTLGFLSVMSMFLISMGVTVTTPAMATIAAQFPDNNYALVSTLPTLFVVPASLICGAIVGKKVKYRTCAILGSAVFLIGGVLPAFTTSWTIVLVGRAVLGLGLGILSPLGNALVLGLYDGQKQAKYLGYGTLLMNAGGIVYQMLGGALAEISWQAVFYGHLFGLVGLIMAFFIPEPDAPQIDAAQQSGPKEKMSAAVWIIGILFCVFNVLNYPVMMNLSLLYADKNAGGATAAATSLSMYTIFGCISGFLFGYIFKAIKRFVLSLGYFLCAIGAFLVYWGSSATLMTAGLCCIGFGFSVLMPAALGLLGMHTPPSTIAIGTSVVMALMNLGGFICTYWLQLIESVMGNVLYNSILVEVIILAALGVVFLVYNPYPKQQ
ncbi:MAG: MFS transporter [Lachnospiraceae bacterium]|nr:MFS transporter [Lachnospiraceae bacterium]MDY4969541.1 MFS transporter [Lachnospiraceae bacterium]